MTETPIAGGLLPPPLIHDLRVRASARLFRMTGNPGNRGFGRYVRQRISRMVERERTLTEKAITIAYLSCFLADHLVQAEKVASRMIERRDLTEAEEHSAWERCYGEIVPRVLREVSAGNEIRAMHDRLANYSLIPGALYAFRTRHWATVERWMKLRAHHGDRELLLRLNRLLRSGRTARAKARSVVITASMLADRACWIDHVPWDHAYRHAMTDLYPRLAGHPDVLEELV